MSNIPITIIPYHQKQNRTVCTPEPQKSIKRAHSAHLSKTNFPSIFYQTRLVTRISSFSPAHLIRLHLRLSLINNGCDQLVAPTQGDPSADLSHRLQRQNTSRGCVWLATPRLDSVFARLMPGQTNARIYYLGHEKNRYASIFWRRALSCI